MEAGKHVFLQEICYSTANMSQKGMQRFFSQLKRMETSTIIGEGKGKEH